jgi:hypothetical protein
LSGFGIVPAGQVIWWHCACAFHSQHVDSFAASVLPATMVTVSWLAFLILLVLQEPPHVLHLVGSFSQQPLVWHVLEADPLQ